MASAFTDAKLNLFQSVLYATDDDASDVSIAFGGIVIAGTRARKQRTMSFNAFTSVNFPPLAYIRTDRIVRSAPFAHARKAEGPRGHAAAEHPVVYDKLDPRVFALKLTPGLDSRIFSALAPSYDAVILETFGIGGIPEQGETGPCFQDALYSWVDSGRIAVMTTQVPEEGLDLGVYEVGRAYANHPGILRGADMTPEAIVAKTMWALGQTRDVAEVEHLFNREINHDRSPFE